MAQWQALLHQYLGWLPIFQNDSGNFLGTPFIAVRYPQAKLSHQREQWWLVDRPMHEAMQELGVIDGFHSRTLLGDIFFI